MRHSLRALALTALAAFVLTGCLKVEMDLVLDTDNTVSGTVTYGVLEGTASQLGGLGGEIEAPSSDEALATDFFSKELGRDFESGVESAYSALVDDADGAAQDGPRWVGTTVTFENEDLTLFTDDIDGFTIVREGDEFVVTAGPNGYWAQDPEVLASMENPDMTLSVTFPGTVRDEDHNGVLDDSGRTVTWNLAEVAPGELSARGPAVEDSSQLIMVLAILGVIAVTAIVTFAMMRLRGRSRSTSDDAKSSEADATEPEAPAAPEPEPALETKAPAKRTPAKKAPAAKAPATKATAAKTPTKKAPAKSATAKPAASKPAATKRKPAAKPKPKPTEE